MAPKYADQRDVLVGDAVDIGNGLLGIVEAILEDYQWVNEATEPIGVYVRTDTIGLVRVSPSDPDLRLLLRAAKE